MNTGLRLFPYLDLRIGSNFFKSSCFTVGIMKIHILSLSKNSGNTILEIASWTNSVFSEFVTLKESMQGE